MCCRVKMFSPFCQLASFRETFDFHSVCPGHARIEETNWWKHFHVCLGYLPYATPNVTKYQLRFFNQVMRCLHRAWRVFHQAVFIYMNSFAFAVICCVSLINCRMTPVEINVKSVVIHVKLRSKKRACLPIKKCPLPSWCITRAQLDIYHSSPADRRYFTSIILQLMSVTQQMTTNALITKKNILWKWELKQPISIDFTLLNDF